MNTLKITFITLAFIFSYGNILSKDKTNKNRKLFFPNIDNYQTLISDLHQHTVFSDGLVWPSIRVDEAIYDGVDIISMTEHLEYQPHLEDIPNLDRNRVYNLTKKYAENYNSNLENENKLVVINGQEITRSMPPGHVNAIFIEDANTLLHNDSLSGILDANKQKAFLFWNHPAWSAQRSDGIAKLDEFHKFLISNNYLHGIEVVNEVYYSEEAFQIALDNNLTIMGNSDVHGLIDWTFEIPKYGHRPVTLIFSKSKKLSDIKNALFKGRTVVYYNDLLIGKEENLKPLIEKSIEVSITGKINQGYSEDGASTILSIEIKNKCSADLILKNLSNFTFEKNADIFTVKGQESITLRTKVGDKKMTELLKFKVLNGLIEPKKYLEVEFPTGI
jgi:3',5'-nucleoside bisphosphate phosphatase|tara:strand:- start:12390 stop:13556 length:1167 start_codon:yes stop_codon:yes gene_type:complete